MSNEQSAQRERRLDTLPKHPNPITDWKYWKSAIPEIALRQSVFHPTVSSVNAAQLDHLTARTLDLDAGDAFSLTLQGYGRLCLCLRGR
jgi:hypothetical protein